MTRLATLELRRKRDGRISIVNQSEYMVNLHKYGVAYDIVSERRGDAPPEEEAEARIAAKVERHRNLDPEENRKRKIDENKFEARKVRLTDATAEQVEVPPAAAEAETAEAEPQPGAAVAVDPEWRNLQWFKRREYVEQITGTKPKSAKQAEDLMAPFEGSPT